MKKYLLDFVVFAAGGIVMVLELTASRILAPYVGVSIIVWTSLIGVILGSLSLGYYLGGKLADSKPRLSTLSAVLYASAILVASILLIRKPILAFIDLTPLTLGLKAIVSAVILFSVPSVLLGMVAPIAAKLKIISLKSAGKTVGNLYAFSTVGSIFGTFLAGFILLAYFSLTQILVGLSIALFLLASLITIESFSKKISLLAAVIIVGVALNFGNQTIKEFDSLYNHIQIYEAKDYRSSHDVKILKLDNKMDSAQFLDREGLVFEYTKYYHLAKLINSQASKILMIGGGAYSVPQDFLRLYPEIRMDVVEIDPFLTRIAMEEFGLKKDPRMGIYHEDGRTFLNREAGKRKYDAILIDAFKSYSIPYQLTTIEPVQKIHELLNDDGVAIVNIVSAIEGEKGEFLQAEYATYKAVFPQVYIYPIEGAEFGAETQNLILLAVKGNRRITDFPQFQKVWTEKIESKPILTDDYAPVDQYVIKNQI